MLRAYKASGISERMLQTPYLRNNETAQLISQYREMKKEWHENVYLARSKIQGLGLYAKKDLDMNQMIIEYIGEMIRNEVDNFKNNIHNYLKRILSVRYVKCVKSVTLNKTGASTCSELTTIGLWMRQCLVSVSFFFIKIVPDKFTESTRWTSALR